MPEPYPENCYQNQILMVIQITKVAKERDKMRRAEYSQWIAQYLPEERVYVDESSSGGTIAFIRVPMTKLSSTSLYGSSISVGSSSGSRLKGETSSSANISWLRS